MTSDHWYPKYQKYWSRYHLLKLGGANQPCHTLLATVSKPKWQRELSAIDQAISDGETVDSTLTLTQGLTETINQIGVTTLHLYYRDCLSLLNLTQYPHIIQYLSLQVPDQLVARLAEAEQIKLSLSLDDAENTLPSGPQIVEHLLGLVYFIWLWWVVYLRNPVRNAKPSESVG